MTGNADSLTPRERQVLDLVDAGLGDEAIADRLGIARSSVAALLRSSMGKLGVETRLEAVATARRA